MKIIIPMSGIGKRFMDAGYTDPKPLIVVDGKPIIHHVIALFPGESEFIFVCNEIHLQNTLMRKILLDACPTAKIVSIKVTGDPNRGPVSSVLHAIDYFSDDDEVIVSYCDYGTQWIYKSFLCDMRKSHADGGIACYKGFHPHMLGKDNYAFVREQNRWMEEIREKQSFTNDKMSEYASNGTYYFSKGLYIKKYFREMINLNMRVGDEFYVSLVYNLMVKEGLRIRIHEISKMLQWGTPKDLQEYNQWSDYFTGGYAPLPPQIQQDTSLQLRGLPQLGEDSLQKNEPVLLLPMAGRGSRFVEDGYTTPKPLLDINGIPMFVRAVQQIPETSKQLLLCQESHKNSYPIEETFQRYFPDSQIETIDYITEGQACSCEILLDKADIGDDTPILISACDNGISYSHERYEQLRLDPEVDVIVWAFSKHTTSEMYPEMYAWLDVEETTNEIKRVSVKKPFTDCPNRYCIIGTMYFKKTVLFREGLKYIYDNDIRTNGEFYVDNVIQALITKGYKCKMLVVDHYLCWGTPNDYKTYQYWAEYFLPSLYKSPRNLIFIGYPAYGDFLSFNGMIRYLVNFYEKIQFKVLAEEHREYLSVLFQDISEKVDFCFKTVIDHNTDILNTTTHRHNNLLRGHVPKERYFDMYNPFIFGGIQQKHIPQIHGTNNATNFYDNVGISMYMRLTNFFFVRDFKQEENFIEKEKPYIIRNDYDDHQMMGISQIKKNVNIHFKCHCPLYLLSLFEQADEIHLLENSLLLMLYHMEYSKITNIKSPVFVHIYARENRGDLINMVRQPILPNWYFIDKPPESILIKDMS